MESQSLDLIPSREVARRLGVDVSTVAKWARDGKLRPAYEHDGLRGVRLFHIADVERFVTERAS